MARKRPVLVVSGVLLLLVCCGTFGRTIWPPVQVQSLCGVYESQRGGSIEIASDGSVSASNVTFGRDVNSELETISGSGRLELDRSLTASTQAALLLEDVTTRVRLEVERNWQGEIFLWRYIDDPDSGGRETFRRQSAC